MALATETRTASRAVLAGRIAEGVAAGDVPPGTDLERLALFFDATFRGMAVQARDGVGLETLRQLGQDALTVFPTPVRRDPPAVGLIADPRRSSN